MRYVVGFARFWYEFIVGDDWRVALGVVVALALTEVLTRQDVAAGWLLPVAVVATLFASLRRATRQQ
jgi:hypothetical protein